MSPKPLVVALASLLFSWSAAAQSDADRAAAQTLFEEGQTLKEQGDINEACRKFQASMKLDPAVGTRLNLADCFEREGKTASAWVNYVEVAQDKDAGKRRAGFARERADALRPRLTKLTIEVAAPTPDMKVQRGDLEVPRETWGSAIPVDPGVYRITARAPGKSPWRQSIEVEGEGETVTVRVPALIDRGGGSSSEDWGSGANPDFGDVGEKPHEEEADGSGQRIGGGVVMGFGIAGIVVGAVLAPVAHKKASDSEEFCLPDDPNQCNQEGKDMRDQAQAMQAGYIACFAAGGALFIAGLVTFVTAPDGKEHERASLMIGPTSLGMRLRW